jgi:hypothetical protein
MQNGARRICLTSRSGRESVFKRNDIPALQALLYLESLSDLALTLAAADASDEEAMRSVISSLSGPIGGCMLLSVVLTDRTFSRHTEESYRSSFPSKVGAFEIIESLVDIPSMEFLIAFTSITALLGNAGQTNYTWYAGLVI